MANLENRRLALGPYPEVALIQKERGTMFLRRDREVRARPDDFDVAEGNLDAARSALVLAHDPGDADRRFLRHGRAPREDPLGELRLHRDALNDSTPVPHEQELELAARATVVEPSLEKDLVADPLPQRPDSGRVTTHLATSAGCDEFVGFEAGEDTMAGGISLDTPDAARLTCARGAN